VVSIPACHAGDPGSIPGDRNPTSFSSVSIWRCCLCAALARTHASAPSTRAGRRARHAPQKGKAREIVCRLKDSSSLGKNLELKRRPVRGDTGFVVSGSCSCSERGTKLHAGVHMQQTGLQRAYTCSVMSCGAHGRQHGRKQAECSRATLFLRQHTVRRRMTDRKIQQYTYKGPVRRMARLRLQLLKWPLQPWCSARTALFP
jgi:hypothetical protein